ncbi:non-hydrolyzing UDP-N-acetylglucosamine 2-epimerase [Microvirga alba]|uniref:UDP-N-acetylglucosamine 2-epimerase (Non-hydrolyzing) n=1 Tax=Microvirga alba TaxID=2791025 RepID=A0A931BSE8_9HYPH|nr:UDP-N-acetylglucosamine 2-epimerase (non-hydrolyzing) [Microvirga alba]MBF9231992.1 UDP-N-acetylglucosamine 2-epimerase (non-hydrolyzing) [Microvirga alba]
MSLTVLTVVGARPQFIKAAPVSHAFAAHGGIREILVHTGQHFDAAMSDVFFEELDIPPPAHNLEVNSLGHGAMTGRMLEKLEEVMIAEKPDWVLIYGDTNSTVAGALAAAKLHIPVAHVEAGLRSFNRRMPEEINRVMADHISTLLYCPTQTAVVNLKAEGITKGVHHVGDVMYDVTLAAVERAKGRSEILNKHGLTPKTYAVATIHRAENTDDPERFARVIQWLSDRGRDVPIIMPVHPRTRKLMEKSGLNPAGVQLIEPLGYLDMAWLTHNASGVFTDSGGLQKEAYFHRVPCVTLRDETEWVETVEAGWNRLWTDADYKPRQEISEYGIGKSSAKIAQSLVEAKK